MMSRSVRMMQTSSVTLQYPLLDFVDMKSADVVYEIGRTGRLGVRNDACGSTPWNTKLGKSSTPRFSKGFTHKSSLPSINQCETCFKITTLETLSIVKD